MIFFMAAKNKFSRKMLFLNALQSFFAKYLAKQGNNLTWKSGNKISNFEINRKILHILFALVPISLYYLPSFLILPLVVIFAITAIVLDLTLKKITLSGKMGNVFYRQSELSSAKKFSGSFWIAVSCIICVIFFNPSQYIPAMLAISFCDTLASVVGQSYGKNRLFGTKKTIEGSMAFIFGVIPIQIILTIIGLKLNFVVLFFAIVFAAICELITFMDDNLSVMLAVCLFLALFAL